MKNCENEQAKYTEITLQTLDVGRQVAHYVTLVKFSYKMNDTNYQINYIIVFSSSMATADTNVTVYSILPGEPVLNSVATYPIHRCK